MTGKRKGKRITCYIDELDYAYLCDVAAETGESTSVHIRCALHDYLVNNYHFDDVVNNSDKRSGYYIKL